MSLLVIMVIPSCQVSEIATDRKAPAIEFDSNVVRFTRATFTKDALDREGRGGPKGGRVRVRPPEFEIYAAAIELRPNGARFTRATFTKRRSRSHRRGGPRGAGFVSGPPSSRDKARAAAAPASRSPRRR